jgi:conjugation system TraG family ATPase
MLGLTRLSRQDLWSSQESAGLIERYYTLEDGPGCILQDVKVKGDLTIGDKHTRLYTVSEADHLPSACAPYKKYDPYSTETTESAVGFASKIGPLLPYDHICNQVLVVEDQQAVLKKLESRRLRLQSLSHYSRENAVNHESVGEFLQEAAAGDQQIIRAHFNVFVWTRDKASLSAIQNQTSSSLSSMEITPKLESTGAAAIWWACLPGNEGDFPLNDSLLGFSAPACCLLQYETIYQTSTSPFGLRLGDRLTGRPLHVDIDQEPRSKGIIGNSNAVVISGSGGGKSFAVNHIVRSYYDQGMHVLTIDVGGSYETQCALHKGYYFVYEESRPIQFNPFFLGPGDVMDTEKKESIKTLLLALWKKSEDGHNRSEYVALSNALRAYFSRLEKEPSIFPCFDSFYEFLQVEFQAILAADGVKEKDFDVSNFLYVLRPFYRGGEFDYLLNARKNLDLLHQRFIVFELDNIKDHPILFPVVTLIIMELFVSKMRKLKGVRKMIVIEEAWKAIARQGMAEYIKYLFKTVRKFQARAMVVTQEIDDIVSSDIIKQAIINNADIKILLDQSKFRNKFGDIQQLLGITEKQKAEIQSINRGHAPGRIYKDLWIGLGSTHSKVYRLEVSPEEYFIYTSEQNEKMEVAEYMKRYPDVRLAVRALLENKQF